MPSFGWIVVFVLQIISGLCAEFPPSAARPPDNPGGQSLPRKRLSFISEPKLSIKPACRLQSNRLTLRSTVKGFHSYRFAKSPGKKSHLLSLQHLPHSGAIKMYTKDRALKWGNLSLWLPTDVPPSMSEHQEGTHHLSTANP